MKLLISLLMAVLLYSCCDKCDTEAIQRKYDSLSTENAYLYKKQAEHIILIDSLSNKSVEIKEKIVYLNNRKNERIRIIDTMSDSELDSFLANIKAN